MKHIKTFENSKELKYNSGDYVLLLDDINNRWVIDLICKIVDVYVHDYNGKQYYQIISYELNRPDVMMKIWVEENEIERKLTFDEIEEYFLSKTMKKYNL